MKLRSLADQSFKITFKFFILAGAFFGFNNLQAQTVDYSKDQLIFDETITSTVTRSYQIVKSLTIKPKSDGSPNIISSTNGTWHARCITREKSNVPPSLDQNFVRTESALVPITDENQFAGADHTQKVTSYEYSDGLGRLKQRVLVKSSPTSKDIIQPYAYNSATGLQDKSYLPYTINNGNPGQFRANAVSSEQGNFYSNGSAEVANDPNPYSKTVYEDSPRRRVKERVGAGDAWQDESGDKGVTYEYLIYDELESNNFVQKWEIVTNANKELEKPKQADGEYGTGDLRITQATVYKDLLTQTVSQTITDSRGLTVAKRTRKGGAWVTTYYIYDDFGRKRFILTPVLADVSIPTITQIEELAFAYIYDARGRLIKEKAPGSGWVYHCYDKWDRLVMTQDAAQRESNDWTFYKYDKLNRVIMTGRRTENTTPEEWWEDHKDFIIRDEERKPNSSYGYTTSETLPTSINEVYTITYYDDYDFTSYTDWDMEGIDFSFASDGLNISRTDDVLGQVTGSKVKVLGTDKWLSTVVYYDKYLREIQIVSENHLGGFDRLSTEYNFAGEALEAKLTHSKTTSGSDLTYEQSFKYDDRGKLLKVWNKINDQSPVLVASYDYNEVGELIEKNLHSTNGGKTFLQSLDYRYNIRGWLETINKSDLSDDGTANETNPDLFGAKYHYTDNLNIGGFLTLGQYDGTLAGMEWQGSNNGVSSFKRAIYGYRYNDLNFLREARYATYGWGGREIGFYNDYEHYNVNISYADDNGNIQSINRKTKGNATPLDDLAFTYEPNTNRITNVVDSGDGNSGFKDLPLGDGEYEYTAQGNLSADGNKEIIDITYNHLQLIASMTFHDGKILTYAYDAVGNRLNKTLQSGDGQILGKIDYVGAVTYEDDELHELNTDDGRAYYQNGAFHYEYMIKDHQGNNRVAFGDLPYRKEYLATFEASRLDAEKEDFVIKDNYLVSGGWSYNHTPGGEWSVALNSRNALNMVGPATVLNIAEGDKVDISVLAKHEGGKGAPQSPAAGFSAAIEALLNEVPGAATEATVTIKNGISNAFSGFYDPGTTDRQGQPYAFLQWVFFDKNYNLVTTSEMTGYLGIGDESADYFAEHAKSLTFDQPGYLYVFVANGTQAPYDYNVYFDDFRILHESSVTSYQVTQVNDYYPFGSIMATSWRQPAYQDPGLMYQSSFAKYDSLTQQYDFLSRSYDPYLGRFHAVDPAGQFASPYAGMGNMPHLGVDPDGAVFAGLGSFLIGLAVDLGINLGLNAAQSGVDALNGGNFNQSFASRGVTAGNSFFYNYPGAININGQPINQTYSTYTGGYSYFNANEEAYYSLAGSMHLPGVPNPNSVFGGTLSTGNAVWMPKDINQALLALGDQSGGNPWYNWFRDDGQGGAIMREINEWNPLAQGVNGLKGLITGTDVDGNAMSSGESTINLAFAFPFFKAGQALRYTQKQVWKKFGEHYAEFGLKHGKEGMEQYLKMADDIHRNPTIRHVFPDGGFYSGETWMFKDGVILRLDPDGNFRSMYNIFGD